MGYWTYTDTAIQSCFMHGFTNERVAAVVLSDESTVERSVKGREVRSGNGISAVVHPDKNLIIAVYPEGEHPRVFEDRPRSNGGGGGSVHHSIEELVEIAVSQGWRLRQGSKHRVLYPTDKSKDPVGVPTSASDWRAARNLEAQLKRNGLDLG